VNDVEAVNEDSDNASEVARRFLVTYRTPCVVLVHAGLFALALLSAFLLAYNFRFIIRRTEDTYTWVTDLYLPLLALAIPTKLAVFGWSRQYRTSWRYVGLRDLFSVISASLIASFVFLSVYFIVENGWHRFVGSRLIDQAPTPRLRQSSVFLLDWAATVGFVCAARVFVRFYHEDIQPKGAGRQSRVMIAGAGDAGEALAREMRRTRRDRYECVGFVDDEVPSLHGRIHDVEILGRTKDLRRLCESMGVQEVFIALPGAGPRRIRELVEQCEGTGVLFRTMPALEDVMEGRVHVSSIRDVDIADLLGREPVQLDTELIGRQLRGRCVLVTGAGGSIGSELCRQAASFSPSRLVLVEQAENGLFEIDRELRSTFVDVEIVPIVADIVDRARIAAILERESPSVVFHAAAHKHVPMMEINPGEAIKNNVLGTATVADAAMATGVEKMVLVSTDKAVNPTSVMGCTKRIAEMYVQSLSGRSPTQFITVRFGNVLGSSGSVVPIFKDQIARGGPVTVTHPEMTRYFMTIPEAAQLVLQAGTMGKGGEIFMLHMGEPVKIVDLARDMIALSGLRPGIDIEIVFTGKRAGEKLFEELSGKGEEIGDTAHPKIGIWRHRSEDREAVRRGIEGLLRIVDSGSVEEIQAELRRIVQEYVPDASHLGARGGKVKSASTASAAR